MGGVGIDADMEEFVKMSKDDYDVLGEMLCSLRWMKLISRTTYIRCDIWSRWVGKDEK